MGFHPKNGLHQGMKVRLSIWTFWICDSKTVEVSWKLRNCKSWKLKNEEIYFEDLGHQLGKLGQTHVLGFYPPI